MAHDAHPIAIQVNEEQNTCRSSRPVEMSDAGVVSEGQVVTYLFSLWRNPVIHLFAFSSNKKCQKFYLRPGTDRQSV